MKKSIAIFAIIASLIGAFAFTYQTTPQWPNGVSTPLTIAVTGTTALSIGNKMNHVASVPTLTGNITVSVTAATGLKAGALMSLTVKTTSLETVTFAGSGIAAPTFTGVAGKTFSQGFIYNGSKFYPVGTKVQVD
jgi:hypothetical protein